MVFILFLGAQFLHSQHFAGLDSIMRVGFTKIEKGNYNGAIIEFDKVLGVHPGSIQAMGGKISANISANRLREGQRLIDLALQRNGQEPEIIFWRGVLSNARKQYERAIEDFNISLALNPSSNVLVSRIYQNKAVALDNLNDPIAAFENLEMAIKANPMNIGAYNVRGLILYRAENFNEALSDFTKITEIEPSNDVAFYNKAMSYFRLNDKKNACIFFHRACQLGNRNACQMIILECQ